MLQKTSIEKEHLKEFYNTNLTDEFKIDDIRDKYEDYNHPTYDDIEFLYPLYLKDSQILDDDTLYKLFANRIDVRKLMSDENFTSKYRYLSTFADKTMLIKNTIMTAFNDDEISDYDYRILFDNILYRLKQHTDDYFAQLKVQAEKLPTEEVFSFLFENEKDYLYYMKPHMNVTDVNTVLYILLKYYPSSVLALLSQHIQDIYNVYERARQKQLDENITRDAMLANR